MFVHTGTPTKVENDYPEAFVELERGVYTALKTYSNVERGSGHYSQVSTALFEKARMIVLEHLKSDKTDYVVIFCTPHRAEILKAQLSPVRYHMLSSQDIGLPIGVRALVVKRNALPKGVPFQTGGGMIKLVSPKSLVLADIPERFEAGTPGIMNIIAFAKALQLAGVFGESIFRKQADQTETATAATILYQDDFLECTGRQLLAALRKSMLDRGVRVPTWEGEKPYINLDNGASTPAFSPVWDAVCQTWRQPGHVRQHIVSEVKEICAGFLGAPLTEYDVIFCSNTTEAINIAVQNLERDVVNNTEPIILNTLLEHHSNELPWRYMPNTSLIRLAVDDEGFVNLDDLERLLHAYNQEHIHGKQRIRIVAVSGASNVLGSFNDIRAIAQIARAYHAHILVDGAQLAAHRKISMVEDGIDYLAFSGHKMYAPLGSGVLLIRKELLNFTPNELATIQASGEENVVGIAAMGKAFMLLQRIGMDVINDEERTLTRRALQGLSKIPGVKIFGVQNPNSAQFRNKGGIIVFSLTHVPHNLVSLELAEKGGIGVRTGCFCAHLITKQLMKIHPFRSFAAEIFLKLIPGLTNVLPGLVRVSLGLENDEHDIDHLIHILQNIASVPRSFTNKVIASTYNGTPFLPHTTIQKYMKAFTEAAIGEVYSYAVPNTISQMRRNTYESHCSKRVRLTGCS